MITVMTNANVHRDGTPCVEGAQAVPSAFVACCSALEERTRACVIDVRFEFWPEHKAWFIPLVPDAGGGAIEIAFCPHCGTRLIGTGAS